MPVTQILEVSANEIRAGDVVRAGNRKVVSRIPNRAGNPVLRFEGEEKPWTPGKDADGSPAVIEIERQVPTPEETLERDDYLIRQRLWDLIEQGASERSAVAQKVANNVASALTWDICGAIEAEEAARLAERVIWIAQAIPFTIPMEPGDSRWKCAIRGSGMSATSRSWRASGEGTGHPRWARIWPRTARWPLRRSSSSGWPSGLG